MKTLPKELKLDLWDILDSETQDRVSECISDYLSEKYGFCTNSYGYETPLLLHNINWDTDE